MLTPGFVEANPSPRSPRSWRPAPAPASRSSATSMPGGTCTTPAVVSGRQGAGPVLQAAPPQLRRVRRSPHLPPGQRRHRPGGALRRGWGAGGRHHLRGRLVTGRAHPHAGRRRRRARREHQRLARTSRGGSPSGSGCSQPAPPTRRVPLVYVNLVGGQDELVFDGASLVFDADGDAASPGRAVRRGGAGGRPRGPAGVPQRLLDPEAVPAAAPCPRWPSPTARPRRREPVVPVRASPPSARSAEVYEALVLGTRDYVHKNGFRDVVIGLSGGIDSSLVAAIAVDALGRRARARRARCRRATRARTRAPTPRHWPATWASTCAIIAIEPAFTALLDDARRRLRRARPADLTEENLQARIRGDAAHGALEQVRLARAHHRQQERDGRRLLHALRRHRPAASPSSRTCPRLLVYELCRYRNERRGRERHPRGACSTKPPSAELRPDQRTTRRLPPYEVLDPILEAYVEDDRTRRRDRSPRASTRDVVRRVIRLVDLRRVQAPPVAPRASACRPRRSARTVASPSPTATAADPDAGGRGAPGRRRRVHRLRDEPLLAVVVHRAGGARHAGAWRRPLVARPPPGQPHSTTRSVDGTSIRWRRRRVNRGVTATASTPATVASASVHGER